MQGYSQPTCWVWRRPGLGCTSAASNTTNQHISGIASLTSAQVPVHWKIGPLARDIWRYVQPSTLLLAWEGSCHDTTRAIAGQALRTKLDITLELLSASLQVLTRVLMCILHEPQKAVGSHQCFSTPSRTSNNFTTPRSLPTPRRDRSNKDSALLYKCMHV